MLKRFFVQAGSLLILFVCFSCFLTSCAQEISQNIPQSGTISFNMSKETVEKLLNKYEQKSSSRNAVITETYPDEEYEYKIEITLICNGVPATQPLLPTDNGFMATFTGLPVGSLVKAKVSLYVDDYLFAYGESAEIIVTAGDNYLAVTMTDPLSQGNLGGGMIELGITQFVLKQNALHSGGKKYQNLGSMAFSLLDENGQDIFADVDWNEQLSKEAFDFLYRVKYRSTDVTDYFETKFNTISVSDAKILPFYGTLQVSVMVSYGSSGAYINNDGELVKLPTFEAVSGSFDFVVDSGILINVDEYWDQGSGATYDLYPDTEEFQNVLGGYNTFNTLAIGIQEKLLGVNSDLVKLILRGITDLTYTDLTSAVLTVGYLVPSTGFEVDLSDVVTNNTDEDARVLGSYDGYGTSNNGDDVVLGAKDENPYNIVTLILPNDLIALGKNVFSDSYINTIKCGEGLTRICYGALGRSNLANISFAENSNLQIIEDYAFSQTNLSEFEIPSSVIAIGACAFYRMNGSDADGLRFKDISGTWYYAGSGEVNGKTQWETWVNGTQIPPDHDDSVPFGEETDILNAVKNSSESKLYWFCVKD